MSDYKYTVEQVNKAIFYMQKYGEGRYGDINVQAMLEDYAQNRELKKEIKS
jgi:hypothetical protein